MNEGECEVSNIIKLGVNEMINLLEEIISVSNICEVPSIMLWGPPGVGKSRGVFGLAERLKEKLNKKVIVHDIRLINFNPVDLRGIPTSDVDKKFAIWLKPKIFDMDSSDDVINILFLDEISACVASVQAAAYQITLDKKVGEHELPENCIVIAAGNRVTDKAVSYKMSSALANRMTHLEIEPSVDDWKTWAYNNGIDERIISYINYKNSSLFRFNPGSDDVAFPTPRSWEMANFYLTKLKSVDKAYGLIAGAIGLGTAVEFRGFTKIYSKLPDIEKIFKGENVEVPSEPDILYAVSGAIVSRVKKSSKPKELDNAFEYIEKMPIEYGVLIVKDMLKIKGLSNKLTKTDNFDKWLEKFGKYVN